MARPWQITALIIISVLFCLKSVETTTATEITLQIQFYKDFLIKINDEDKFENCLIYGEFGEKSETLALLLQIIVEDFKKPIIFQNMNSFYQISDLFNRKIIVIAHLANFDSDLPVLAVILNRMRQKRIVLVSTERANELKTEQYLTQLFRLCEAEKMLNVVVIFMDFPQTKMFYSYTIFPTFQLEKKSLRSSGVEVFPPRMKNLHGYGIRTMPEQLFPFSFVYEQDGRIKVAGYVQNLVKTFARSINATLYYPLPVKSVSFDVNNVVNMTLNNMLDIPISRLYLINSTDLDQGSKPFGISSLCIVVPVKWYHTFESFYNVYSARLNFFTISSLFVTFTILYYCRRLQCKLAGKHCNLTFLGALINPSYLACQLELQHSVKLPRLATMRVLVFLTLIWILCVNTHFTANLNTFVTKHIKAPSPESWDDFNRLDYKLLLSAMMYRYISRVCGDFCENFERSIVLVDSMDEYLNELYKLNTNYAYPSDLFFWAFLKLRMRAMKQPIFRLTDMCFRRHLLSSVLLPENSVFKEALNLFITRYTVHGLDNVWLDSTIMETEKFGKIHNEAHMTEQSGRPLDMAYISSLWKMLVIVWILGVFIFACEVVIGRRQRRIQRNNVSN